MASRRKGWEQLTDKYRQRLTRAGVTPQQYASGVSLGKARGHTPIPGVGEKMWIQLRAVAKRLGWGDTGRDELLKAELAKGQSSRWLLARLKERLANTREYRRRSESPAGRRHWEQRRQYAAIELYWYH